LTEQQPALIKVTEQIPSSPSTIHIPGTDTVKLGQETVTLDAVLETEKGTLHGSTGDPKPHVKWRFWVLSAALGLCLGGGFWSAVPAESRTAALTLAGTIISAMAKPLEGMDP
jgi:hypothetical protein